jgi:hypothetical protein
VPTPTHLEWPWFVPPGDWHLLVERCPVELAVWRRATARRKAMGPRAREGFWRTLAAAHDSLRRRYEQIRAGVAA